MHPIFDTAFYKILNVIGVICQKIYCHKVLFYVANILLWFDLR